jgi:hypothetical protein
MPPLCLWRWLERPLFASSLYVMRRAERFMEARVNNGVQKIGGRHGCTPSLRSQTGTTSSVRKLSLDAEVQRSTLRENGQHHDQAGDAWLLGATAERVASCQ